MAVEVVGWLLAARAMSSVLSRFLFARLHALMGHWRLMMTSVLASAISYAAVALPLPIPVMLAVVAVAGFALGIAITATIAALLNLATPETRGTANSLRIMGNRAGQLVIPFSVGLVAAATGAAGIFVIIGLSLTASTVIMVLASGTTERALASAPGQLRAGGGRQRIEDDHGQRRQQPRWRRSRATRRCAVMTSPWPCITVLR